MGYINVENLSIEDFEDRRGDKTNSLVTEVITTQMSVPRKKIIPIEQPYFYFYSPYPKKNILTISKF